MSNVDWECVDCSTIYRAPEDAGHILPTFSTDKQIVAGRASGDLPMFCPECGDHAGWIRDL